MIDFKKGYSFAFHYQYYKGTDVFCVGIICTYNNLLLMQV